MKNNTWLCGALGLAVALGAACDGPGGKKKNTVLCDPASCIGGVCAPTGCVTTQTKSLGSDGGELSTEGFHAAVPAGALAGDTELTVAGQAAATAGTVGTTYTFAEGQTFGSDVTVSLGYGGQSVPGNDPTILCPAQIVDGVATMLAGCTVDETAQEASGTTSSGGAFALVLNGPVLSVSPMSVSFVHTYGTSPCPQEIGMVTAQNLGRGDTEVYVEGDAYAITTDPQFATIPAGGSQTFTLFFQCDPSFTSGMLYFGSEMVTVTGSVVGAPSSSGNPY